MPMAIIGRHSMLLTLQSVWEQHLFYTNHFLIKKGNTMRNLFIIGLITLSLTACSDVQKEPPCATQIVNGRSIIIPPEFDIQPK